MRGEVIGAIFVTAILVGCSPGKKDDIRKAESDFKAEAQKLEWYGPAREALMVTIAKWHLERGSAVTTAGELSRFVKGPLQFTVGRGPHAVKRHLDWSSIKVKPLGRDKKRPRFYLYEIEILDVKGRMGVEWTLPNNSGTDG